MAFNTAVHTHGTAMSFTVGGTNYLNNVPVKSINGPSMSASAIDTTHLTSTSGWRTYLQGLKDAGEIALTIAFDPTINFTTNNPLVVTGPGLNNTTGTIVITWPDTAPGSGAGATFNTVGFCIGYEVSSDLDSQTTADLRFKLTGLPTYVAES